MTRRTCVLLAALLPSCHRSAPEIGELLPESPAPDWRRTSLREIPREQIPEMVPSGSLRRAVEAVYAGPGQVTVHLYELASSATALDLAQRWRPAPETVFFYKDEYFAVVRWRDANREALATLVRALETGLASDR
jgi:hypothetical protein